MNRVKVKMESDHIYCSMCSGGKEVSHVKINYSGRNWEITSWFTDKGYQNKGIGTTLLKTAMSSLVQVHGEPERVTYNWNGTNDYVFSWLKRKFNAKCNCPLAVLKYFNGDLWDAHIYTLDTKMVLEFIKEVKGGG